MKMRDYERGSATLADCEVAGRAVDTLKEMLQATNKREPALVRRWIGIIHDVHQNLLVKVCVWTWPGQSLEPQQQVHEFDLRAARTLAVLTRISARPLDNGAYSAQQIRRMRLRLLVNIGLTHAHMVTQIRELLAANKELRKRRKDALAAAKGRELLRCQGGAAVEWEINRNGKRAQIVRSGGEPKPLTPTEADILADLGKNGRTEKRHAPTLTKLRRMYGEFEIIEEVDRVGCQGQQANFEAKRLKGRITDTRNDAK